ncbi:hypothetical protein L1887_62097 [Cichorium endivia]|nr:hypothetical protein L1887_62097 [Cichorium endivia]
MTARPALGASPASSGKITDISPPSPFVQALPQAPSRSKRVRRRMSKRESRIATMQAVRSSACKTTLSLINLPRRTQFFGAVAESFVVALHDPHF